MKKIKITVGLFVLIGMVSIYFLAFRVGQDRLIGEKTYQLTAIFNNLSGVSKNGRVEIAGVRVGSVASIELNKEFQAIAQLDIYQGINLDDDTMASVKTSGLIGDRFIELIPGGSGIFLESGDFIIDTQSALDLESLISKFGLGNVAPTE